MSDVAHTLAVRRRRTFAHLFATHCDSRVTLAEFMRLLCTLLAAVRLGQLATKASVECRFVRFVVAIEREGTPFDSVENVAEIQGGHLCKTVPRRVVTR